MEKEKRYIVAVRCRDSLHVLHGSVKRKCIKCGEEVWVGLALQKEETDGEVCSVCLEEFKSEFGEIVYTIKPEVIEELIELIKLDKMMINSRYN